MKMYDIASCLARHMANEVGIEQSKVDKIRFGLEIILGEIIKIVILIVSAFILDVLPGALFAMISLGIFRLVSGGAHCEDYWRCLTFGILVFLGGGKLGLETASYLTHEIMVNTITACAVIMFVLVLAWAPGEVIYRKIRPEERTMFKVLSLLFLVSWCGGTVYFILPQSIPAAVAGLIGMLVQAISFTPLGYRSIDSFDINLSKILGERRCSLNAENS